MLRCLCRCFVVQSPLFSHLFPPLEVIFGLTRAPLSMSVFRGPKSTLFLPFPTFRSYFWSDSCSAVAVAVAVAASRSRCRCLCLCHSSLSPSLLRLAPLPPPLSSPAKRCCPRGASSSRTRATKRSSSSRCSTPTTASTCGNFEIIWDRFSVAQLCTTTHAPGDVPF